LRGNRVARDFSLEIQFSQPDKGGHPLAAPFGCAIPLIQLNAAAYWIRLLLQKSSVPLMG